MERQELNLSTDWIWLVIRRDDTRDPPDWHLQGTAADESIAVEMCMDETYMIGPVPFNTALPHNKIEWLGCYFPHKRK